MLQSAKAALNLVHDRAVFGRRVQVLAAEIAAAIPTGGSVLDLGAGDGSIAAAVMAARPDLTIRGVDVMLRRCGGSRWRSTTASGCRSRTRASIM